MFCVRWRLRFSFSAYGYQNIPTCCPKDYKFLMYYPFILLLKNCSRYSGSCEFPCKFWVSLSISAKKWPAEFFIGNALNLLTSLGSTDTSAILSVPIYESMNMIYLTILDLSYFPQQYVLIFSVQVLYFLHILLILSIESLIFLIVL